MPRTVAGVLAPFETEAIARALRVDEGTVSRWKTGQMVPSPKRLARIAAFAAIPVEELHEIVAAEKRTRSEVRRGARRAAATV